MGWTIKQMSEKTGLPADSLRYYDKLGIVSPKRSESGYRYYDEKDYIALQYVAVMKYANFSLSEIKEVICTMALEPNDTCNKINRELIEIKKVELQGVIDNYKKIIKLLNVILSMIENTDCFLRNEKEIDALVNKIYTSIRNRGEVENNEQKK